MLPVETSEVIKSASIYEMKRWLHAFYVLYQQTETDQKNKKKAVIILSFIGYGWLTSKFQGYRIQKSMQEL